MKKGTMILTALTFTGLLFTGCATGQAQVNRIDMETAKAAAMEAAGFSDSEVTFLSAELDNRNGIEYYDVDFSAGGKEYDYDIDALTGAVIGSETRENAELPKETLPAETAEASKTESFTPKAEEAATTEPAVTSENELSEAEAKRIALEQVPGASESDIREFEVDYDDGRLEYEGTIIFEEMEYEFEIDGYSGAIRNWDVESIYD